MTDTYTPPYTITSTILRLVAEIGECVGRHFIAAEAVTPRLRRGNRLRTIHASLAIENNTLTLEQVTAVLDGKRVLGHPREILEVQNAFAAYDGIEQWNPASREDLLAAHGTLMAGLVDDAGRFRTGSVGIVQGERVVHVAPPADRVPGLIGDLLGWLAGTGEHPLVASCVFHYEFEFIHPFSDGNGRMGRLWQTLLLSRWRPLMAFLPVETVIRDRQEEYYRVLARSDSTGDSTAFVEFLLAAILEALYETMATDQVSDQHSDQVGTLLKVMKTERPLSAVELMAALGLSHRPSFRKYYLHPALNAGLIEMTIPEKPNSRSQKYRLTEKGRAVQARLNQESKE
ncbi:MAG: cell filamentation protein Fic [Deltaproteobacteria bacterium RIFOXYD12_FULL_57_12]|nr:MAG: cell filamentation protein Fic [Deltaproteobacteria bacterium RIFOXYD12_FULL_57_12]